MMKYPERGINSVQQTVDGGYILSGLCGFPNMVDVWLMKTNSIGLVEWEKTFDMSAYRDVGESVQQTSDGGYIVAGYWWDPSGNAGSEIVLIKTDGSGEVVWLQTYGPGVKNRGHSVCQTFDGGYAVTGFTKPSDPGGWHIYLMKTDSLGTVLWDRVFSTSGILDQGNSVQQTSDSGFVITGVRGWDVCLIKTDENGLIGIEEQSPGPRSRISDVRLLQNHPNPFHNSTVISYSLPATTQVTLAIYDITGRLVETLVNETQQPGIHRVRWDRKTNPSGVYFYSLRVGEFSETRKTVLIR
jgi:hypothetical protein